MDTVAIRMKNKPPLQDLVPVLREHWEVAENADHNGLVIGGPGSRVFISYATPPDDVPNPNTLLLDYHSVQKVNAVIALIADDPEMTVDADFDVVLPGNEFVARVKANPDWDWRMEWLKRKDKL